MPSYDDILTAYPILSDYPQADVEHWLGLAPVAITDHRFGANVERAQRAYVAHATIAHSTRAIPASFVSPQTRTPAERHIRAQAGSWGSTTIGLQLARLAKY